MRINVLRELTRLAPMGVGTTLPDPMAGDHQAGRPDSAAPGRRSVRSSDPRPKAGGPEGFGPFPGSGVPWTWAGGRRRRPIAPRGPVRGRGARSGIGCDRVGPRPASALGGGPSSATSQASASATLRGLDGSHLRITPSGSRPARRSTAPASLASWSLADRVADVVALGVVGLLAEVLLVLGDTTPPSAACLIDRLIRRRWRSRSMIFDPQLLAGVTTCSGRSTWWPTSPRCGPGPDAVADLDERAERHELGDPAVDQLADPVVGGELLPRVLLGGLERQVDALAVEVDLEHLRPVTSSPTATTDRGGRRASRTAPRRG